MNGQWSLATPTVELSEGGVCNVTGLGTPASFRNDSYPSYTYDNVGFRPILYL